MKPIDEQKTQKKKQVKVKKEYLIVIVLCVIAVTLFLSSSSIFSSFKKSSSADQSYEETIEFRLENLLKEVDGVGKVKVFVTTDGSERQEILKDVEIKSENGVNFTEESVILVGGKPYVTNTSNPEIVGIAVVCQGADNLSVKVMITEIITTTLSVDADAVRIIKMK